MQEHFQLRHYELLLYYVVQSQTLKEVWREREREIYHCFLSYGRILLAFFSLGHNQYLRYKC